MNPTWEAYCLVCGTVAEALEGDPMEQAAKHHKHAYPTHRVLIASEIKAEEVA